MDRRSLLTSLMLIVVGIFALMNSLDNARLAAIHGSDIVKLLAVGLLFGVALGIQIGARVFAAPKTQL